ncbi:MAG TPA: CoA transferase [Pseudonocardia sp.]|nr:CoA transferase [Pseudonocardia sp.]
MLEGVRVLEVAEYGMVPAAASVLAEWGADVIKVEHSSRGDAIRGINAFGVPPGAGGFSYLWETFNRGKRSVGVDVAAEAGLAIVHQLAAGADVFLTNFLPEARRRLRIDVDDIRAVKPDIVYGRGSAHGPRGPEAERGGFDGLTYWYRSGAGSSAMPAGTDQLVPMPGPAFGDIQTGVALAGGVCAALVRRARTGAGTVVDTSLLNSGMWAMQATLVGSNMIGSDQLAPFDRTAAANPLNNTYRTGNGRFLALAMLQADRYWARLCEVIGHPELAGDSRFATIHSRAEHHRACIEALDAIFAARTLAEWEQILGEQEGQWSVVQKVGDLNGDEQAQANGYLQTVDYGDGRTIDLVASPVQFDERPPAMRPAPAHAVHTDEVLAELGYSGDRIIELKIEGAIT